MTERILFVDDEPKILEAYRRTLRKSFTVIAAESGRQALELMAAEGPFPVIVSDMQMPEMNGVELLVKVKQKFPDTIRIMLTGNADQQTAIDAINTSDVYRFLNKPCPPDKMTDAINEALQYQSLLAVEKDLLESTVRGSIATLTEVLSIAKPSVFGRVSKMKNYALACAKQLALDDVWEIETAILLSQIGLISVPDSILEKALLGLPINVDEQAIFEQHPSTAAQIISNIPRLEGIAEAILQQHADYNEADANALPLAARFIRPLVDLVNAEATGLSASESLSKIMSDGSKYDPQIMQALSAVVSEKLAGRIVEMNINQLEEGFELAKDIKTFSGALLIECGQRVSASMVARLVNFAHNGEIDERICVIVRDDDNAASDAA